MEGRGLGTKLMTALDNTRAIDMYHNFGFEIESTVKGSTGKQEHIMNLILIQK
jgi:ribosomal protein S18 acetylase RimI-like enzyme